MADTITIACPKCKKTIKAPESIKGKKIRCKSCGETFAAEELKSQSEEWGEVHAYDMTIERIAPRCPFCAWELEDESQVVCLRCGYNLQTRERLQPRVLEPVGFGEYFLWWLPAALGFLFIAFMVFSTVYTWVWWPKAGWTPAFIKDSPMPYQMFSSILYGFFIWKAAHWIVTKRVMSPHPPEVEKTKGPRGND